MRADAPFLLCEDFTLAVPDERDRYLVEGKGEQFRLSLFETVSDPDEVARVPRGFKPVGFVGLTAHGEVAAFYLPWAEERTPMHPAAASLASSEVALLRRGVKVGAVAWLESLARLVDPRPLAS